MLAARRALAATILAVIAGVLVWLFLPPKYVDWERLQTGVAIRTPPGEGPFPFVLMLHGCGGQRPFLMRYEDAALTAGVAAVSLDSFAPRGMSRAQALLSVCLGARLRGGARAHDIDLVLDNLRDTRLDMGNFALAGWSHGAWSVAEQLTDEPEARGVKGAFLVYPYCRFPSRWPGRTPPDGVRVLAVVPDRDVVGDTPACRRALTRTGAEIVTIEDATHAFEDDYPRFFPYRHNADGFTLSVRTFEAFLRDTLNPGPVT